MPVVVWSIRCTSEQYFARMCTCPTVAVVLLFFVTYSIIILRNMTWDVSFMFSVLFCSVRLTFPAYHSAKSFSVSLWLFFHRTRSMFRVLPSHDPIHHQLE